MELIALDIRTLSFITMSIAALFAIGLFLFGVFQKKYKGFTILASASGCYGCGLFLLGFRDVLPDSITIVVANSLLVAGLALYFEGSRRFLDVGNTIHPVGIIAVLLNLGIFYYYTFQIPSVNHRIIWINLIAACLSGFIVWEFIRHVPAFGRVPRAMMVVVFSLYGLFQMYRAIWTLGESPIQSFMSAGTVHSFAFLVIIMLITGSSFGYIWLVSKQLEFDLTELANEDQLTQILNRRGVETLARHEISKMSRTDAELSVIMIDIDHFKRLNDRFGHSVGDEVLKGFAKLIQQGLRPYDILGRVGGEEFLIILPHTTPEQALGLAERHRDSIEKHIFKIKKNKIQITASFGVANYSSKAKTLAKLMHLADQALYQSKQRGRNQVTRFTPRYGNRINVS
jgi:diguanylate cyclase (GGDEF)-like protein